MNCLDCKHYHKEYNEIPCSTCRRCSNWEAAPKMPKRESEPKKRVTIEATEATRNGKHGVEVSIKTHGLNVYSEHVEFAGRIINAMEKAFGAEIMGGALLVSMFPDGDK